ncbi:hypothetical protein ACWEO2_01440 [Nocardia sp. NPDC004278]
MTDPYRGQSPVSTPMMRSYSAATGALLLRYLGPDTGLDRLQMTGRAG